ncbi:MAG: 50S ribosomal protein L29 [bacterium]|nr:50S ribosomal protein L29 [bacterium]
MKAVELMQKPKTDLRKMLQEQREKSRQLKFDLAGGKVKNIREIRQIRKDIARILTAINKII